MSFFPYAHDFKVNTRHFFASCVFDRIVRVMDMSVRVVLSSLVWVLYVRAQLRHMWLVSCCATEI